MSVTLPLKAGQSVYAINQDTGDEITVFVMSKSEMIVDAPARYEICTSRDRKSVLARIRAKLDGSSRPKS